MFWHLFLPFVVFAQDATPTPVVPTISITSYSSSVNQYSSFGVTLQLINAKANTYYRFKVYGGSSDNNSLDINYNNSDWTNSGDSASWDIMPQYQTNSAGSVTLSFNVRPNSGSTGTYSIYAKVRESGVSSDTATSAGQNLTVNAVSPTPTLTPTLTPTPTPKVTPTPVEPTPTNMPPTPTDVPTDIPKPTSIPTAAPSITDINLNTTTATSRKKIDFLPFLLIGGGILFLSPLVILNLPKFKKR